MEKHTKDDLVMSVEILNTQDQLDQFGNKMWSRENIQWAITVQLFFDRIRLAAYQLCRKFKYSIEVCVRWVYRSLFEGTFKQLFQPFNYWYGLS